MRVAPEAAVSTAMRWSAWLPAASAASTSSSGTVEVLGHRRRGQGVRHQVPAGHRAAEAAASPMAPPA